ncbi:hypothetical protein [Pseudooctadecabacter sp.]|uniref:hypothetical protein n=1 Tax=Pseudooctadecabacter sp. TaxID=1966338 RepID=UPI0025CC6890|nr:hypothetical protein [Pseudooctadecabacter sp.]
MNLPWQQSDLHPHALSVMEDALDRPDLALALAEDLNAFNPPDIIHRYRIVALRGQADETLSANGFTPNRITQLIDLPLSAQDHPALTPLPDHIAAHWFRPGERAPWDAWVQAHWRHYQTTHHSNPPRIPKGGLRDVFIGDDLVEGLALRNGPQGRTHAFASLRTGQELGWIGGDPALLPATLATCLRRATAIGWTKATVEVDDDDHALWSLIGRLNIPPAQTYVTWHRERFTDAAPH